MQKSKEYSDIQLLSCFAFKVLEKTGELVLFSSSEADALICEPFPHYCEGRHPCILNCSWAKLWKRELFDCISFPEGMAYEDLDTTPRLLAGLKKCLYVSDGLFFYQENRNSITGSSISIKDIQDICQVFSRLYLWGLEQSSDRRLLVNCKLYVETDRWIGLLLENKKESADYTQIFLDFFPKGLLIEYFFSRAKNIQRLQQNRWYRFGQLSFKRKIWIIVKVLSKKLKIYKLLKLILNIIKFVLVKGQ